MVIETDIRQDILEWLDAAFAESNNLSEAAVKVAERIVKEGHSEAFVREFGPELLTFSWRHRNAANRRDAASPGERRVDLGTVRESILESLYKVGDEWVRLGDCDQAMCRGAQKWFQKQAEGNMREAFMFSKLADGLKGAKTVRAVFNNEQVRGFLQDFRME